MTSTDVSAGTDGTLVGFLTGPTATGKSTVAEYLAERYDLELLSIDSRQLYRGLDLGTAKPTREERGRCRYHLLDLLSPDEFSSAGGFQQSFRAALEDVAARSRRALAVGGTALYWEACAYGMHPLPPSSPEFRAKWERVWKEQGLEVVFDRLVELDPIGAEDVERDNPHRVLRALELVETTGKTLRDLYSGPRVGGLDSVPPEVILLRPREETYRRIEERCDAMLAAGLIDELRSLLDQGVSSDAPGLRTVGYREFLPFLDGTASLDECRELFVRNSRRYAKRQETWFQNRMPGAHRIELSLGMELGDIVGEVARCLHLA